MAVRPTYQNLPSGGADIVYTITANLTQEDFTTVSTTASEDGVPTAPDSWALGLPEDSAASIVGSGHTVTFTPDVSGIYPISATFGTQVVTRTVAIGVGAGGEWELNRLVDFQSLTAQNLLTGGDGNKTIDGDTWALAGSGGLTSYDTVQTAGVGLQVVVPNASAASELVVPLASLIDGYDWDNEYLFLIRAKLVSGFSAWKCVHTFHVLGTSNTGGGRCGMQWRDEGSGNRIGPSRGNGGTSHADQQAISIPADGIVGIRVRGSHFWVYSNTYTTDVIPVIDDLTHVGASAVGDSFLIAAQTIGGAYGGWTPGSEHFATQTYSTAAGAYTLRIPWMAVLKRRVV